MRNQSDLERIREIQRETMAIPEETKRREWRGYTLGWYDLVGEELILMGDCGMILNRESNG